MQATSKGPDQTAHMRRLVWGFAGRTYPHCWKYHVTAHIALAMLLLSDIVIERVISFYLLRKNSVENHVQYRYATEMYK